MSRTSACVRFEVKFFDELGLTRRLSAPLRKQRETVVHVVLHQHECAAQLA